MRRTHKDDRLEREAKELEELIRLREYKNNPKDCPICKTSDNFKYDITGRIGHGEYSTESKIQCSECGLGVAGYSSYGDSTEVQELKTWERLNKMLSKLLTFNK